MENTIFLMDEREIDNAGCVPDQLEYQFFGIACKYQSEHFRQLNLRIEIESLSEYYQFTYQLKTSTQEGYVIKLSKSEYEKYARDMGTLRYLEFPAQLADFTEIIRKYLLKKGSWGQYEHTQNGLIFEKVLGFNYPFEPYMPWRFKPNQECFNFGLEAYCYIHRNSLKFSSGASLKALKSFFKLEQRIEAEDKIVRLIPEP